MTVLRSVAAVVLGLAFMLTFAGVVAPALGALVGVLGFLAGNGLSAVIGGWLAARIAGRAELAHAAALAAIIATGTIVAFTAEPPGGQPGWYVPVVGMIGVAGVLMGGWVRAAAAEAARP